jgi:hypothetical protein
VINSLLLYFERERERGREGEKEKEEREEEKREKKELCCLFLVNRTNSVTSDNPRQGTAPSFEVLW